MLQAAGKIVLQALPQQCAPDLQSFCYQVSMRLLATSTSFQALHFSSSPVRTPELSATTWQALPVATRQCACGPFGAKVACYQVPTRLWAYPPSHIVSYRVPMRLWALHCQLPSADPPGALVHLPLQDLMLLQQPINGRHKLHKAGLQAPPLDGAVSYQVPVRL